MKLFVDDNIIVKGSLCAAGSKMLYNFRPPFQAEAVDRALAAGYELAGRADIGELALDGCGADRNGQAVPNPLDPSRCGSGGATAILNKQADAVMIVDCGGDAIRMAALSGCPAFRPTYGRVSRFGIIANVSSSEQIGGAAASVREAAALVQAIAGHDDKDATSLPDAGYDFTTLPDIAGMKIAVLSSMEGAELTPEAASALAEAEARLTAAGAIVEPVESQWLSLGGLAYAVMAAAEGCNNISRLDGVKYGYRASGYRDVEELYAKSRSEGLGQMAKVTAILGTYMLSKGRYEQYYYKALQARRLVRDEYSRLFRDYDAILSPAACGPAYALDADLPAAVFADRRWTAPAAIAGLPAAAIPMGSGLPRAVQIAADSHKDVNALAVAVALEGGAC